MIMTSDGGGSGNVRSCRHNDTWLDLAVWARWLSRRWLLAAPSAAAIAAIAVAWCRSLFAHATITVAWRLAGAAVAVAVNVAHLNARVGALAQQTLHVIQIDDLLRGEVCVCNESAAKTLHGDELVPGK